MENQKLTGRSFKTRSGKTKSGSGRSTAKPAGKTKPRTHGTGIALLNDDDCNGMPARMVYSPTGIIPATPPSPDHEPAELVTVTVNLARGSRSSRRTVNGLTARADCMARWVAHGATASDAFRAAYQCRSRDFIAITQRAHLVSRSPGWIATVSKYRDELLEKRAQATVSIGDYVKSRLVMESQDAVQDAARIQSLKLLGMTEGLFTSVQRIEKAINPVELSALKTKLEQRVKAVLARVSRPVQGLEAAAASGESPGSAPHTPGFPLIRTQEDPQNFYTIPLVPSPISEGVPAAEGPVLPTQGGGLAPKKRVLEAVEAPDEAYADFEGPLVLTGGWSTSSS